MDKRSYEEQKKDAIKANEQARTRIRIVTDELRKNEKIGETVRREKRSNQQ